MNELRRTALAAGLLALVALGSSAGLELQRRRRLARTAELREVLSLLGELGPPAALAAREAAVEARRRRATARLAAAEAGAGPFTDHLRTLLRELDLELLATSQWQPLSGEGRGPGARRADDEARWPPGVAVATRTLEVRGDLGALLDAVHGVERWPDRARLRELVVVPAGVGRVRARLQLVLATGSPPDPRDATSGDAEATRAASVASVASTASLARPVLRREPPRDVFTRAYLRARLSDLELEPQGLAGRDPRVALVSGRLLREGERLDVFVVERIDADAVHLRGPRGVVVRLELPGERPRTQLGRAPGASAEPLAEAR